MTAPAHVAARSAEAAPPDENAAAGESSVK